MEIRNIYQKYIGMKRTDEQSDQSEHYNLNTILDHYKILKLFDVHQTYHDNLTNMKELEEIKLNDHKKHKPSKEFKI